MFDFEKALSSPKLTEIKSALQSGQKQCVLGLSNAGIGFCLGVFGSGGALIAPDLVSSSKIANMLTAFPFNVRFLSGGFENDMGLVDENLQDDFFAALGDFLLGKANFFIANATALLQNLPSPKTFLASVITVQQNKTLVQQDLIKQLVQIGYVRADSLFLRGQFAVKGDVVTIAPINAENFVRFEFFDDVIERISEISATDKKFVCTHETFAVLPRALAKENCNLLDFCPKVFFAEPRQIEDVLMPLCAQNDACNLKDIFAHSPKCQLAFASVVGKTFFYPDIIVRLPMENGKNYLYDFGALLGDLRFLANTERQVYIFCNTEANLERLKKFLLQNFVDMTNIHLVQDFLPQTVHLVEERAIFLGTHNLFLKEKTAPAQRKTKMFVPQVGEFVVHDTHGIGKCVGLEKLALADYEKDYIIIEYLGGDKFYLPSEQADSLSRYSAGETQPKLNKLGGAEFARAKEKVYKSVKQMAFDLLKLYANREKAQGVRYQPDDYLSKAFDDAFMFEETQDQLRAIADIKADMESNKIMDRLVCGDVGFGKTEVALRAIYKAVISGKQVAFLCPTTILAEQHYHTCQKRFAGFMVKTARFNRLMTAKEEKEVLAGLESGEINVVCGTHKLLSGKVKFKDLQLLVLDEEQRFGVEDKEKIKNMKNNIDVLSLSATPIPRTLHMSLTGIRDISVIDTPPRQRLPVQTFVTEFDEQIITRAINQELLRGGQVLIIFNNIEKIYDFAGRIKNLVPKAVIGVAHGRLPQRVLEDTIFRLYAGEYQILVSTTLIENGMDLPSANTLIVIDADHLGLAQAYQIRGRIGRGDRQAYAYFLIRENKQISENAYRRLSALMENTTLGSGLKIAMADLNIRGAGNVLGKEQSGNMMKVGYDLYYKLLNVALKDVKGEKPKEQRAIKLDVALSAFVPENYIASENERLKLISDISQLQDKQSAQQFLQALEKTYGTPPEQVVNLARLACLKNLATECGAKQITINQNGYKIAFYEKNDIICTQKATILQSFERVFDVLKDQNGQNG